MGGVFWRRVESAEENSVISTGLSHPETVKRERLFCGLMGQQITRHYIESHTKLNGLP